MDAIAKNTGFQTLTVRLFAFVGAALMGGCNCGGSIENINDSGMTNAYDCKCVCGISIQSDTKTFTVCLPSPVPNDVDGGLAAFLAADCDTRVCRNVAEALGGLTKGKPAGECIRCSGSVPVVHAFNLPVCNSCTTVACTTTTTDGGNLCPQVLLKSGADAGMDVAPDGSGKCCNVVTTDPVGCIAAAGRSVPSAQVCTANNADPHGVVFQTGMLASIISHASTGELAPALSTLTLVPNNNPAKMVTSQVSGRVEFLGRLDHPVTVSAALRLDTSPLALDVDVPLGPLQIPVHVVVRDAALAASSEPAALTLDEFGSGTISPNDFAGFLHGHVAVSSSNPLVPNQGESDRTLFLAPTSGFRVLLDRATGEFVVSGDISVAEDNGNFIPRFVGRLALRGTLSNQPPVANAGADEVVECTSPAGSPISLNGTATDPDNNLTFFAWHRGDNMLGPVVANSASTVLQQPIGTQIYTLVVSDSGGEIDHATAKKTVAWTAPPRITSILVNPSCLWPPNHKKVAFELGRNLFVSATSTCDGVPPQVSIVGVTSDQLDGTLGSGNTLNDFGFDSTRFCLRSERSGTIPIGRKYFVTVQAVDSANHATRSTITIPVGHDQGAPCPAVTPSSFVDDDDPSCLFPVKPSATAGAAPGDTSSPRGAPGGCSAIGGHGLIALSATIRFLRRRRRSHRGSC